MKIKLNQKQVALAFKILVVLLVAVGFTQCGKEKSIENENVSQNAATSDLKSSGAHWSYEGETGPEFWGELDPEYILCAEGLSQSPIDIRDEDLTEAMGSDIIFSYESSSLLVKNNGHAIEVEEYPVKKSYLTTNGVRYNLLQFHFHSPSEHTVNGRFYPIECHFVHQSAAGELLVIGLFFDEGNNNSVYAPIFNNMPAHEGDEFIITDNISVRDFLPTNVGTYRYSGSLTTPPCSEGVNWNVIIKDEDLSTSQIDAFKQIYDGTNRPVLPVNGRVIQESKDFRQW